MTAASSLLLEDAFDLLERVEDADLVLTDPPYGTTRLPWDEEPDWKRFLSLAREALSERGNLVLFASGRAVYRKEGVWGSYNAPVFKPGIHGLPHLRRRRRGTEGIVVYHSWHEGPRVGPTRSNAAGEGDPSMKAEAYPFKGRRRSLK